MRGRDVGLPSSHPFTHGPDSDPETGQGPPLNRVRGRERGRIKFIFE